MAEPPVLEQMTTTLKQLPDALAQITERLDTLAQRQDLTYRQHETILALTAQLERLHQPPPPPPVLVPEVVAQPVRSVPLASWRDQTPLQAWWASSRRWVERAGIALGAGALGMWLLWVGQAEPPYARFAAEMDQMVLRDYAQWPPRVQQAMTTAYHRAGVVPPSHRQVQTRKGK